MTKIYIIDITMTKEEFKLPPFIMEHIEKKSEKAKKISTIAWGYLIKYLKEDFDFELTYLKYNENKKPFVNEINFNISHAKNIIAIAISTSLIGIDVECVKKINHKRKFAKILNDENLENDELIKKWTMYESYIKCLGKKISFTKNQNIDYTNTSTKELNDSLENKYYFSITKMR